MQPSALEARGYTLPTAIPCTSKYPESSVQMKACSAQHPAASPALCSSRPGWQGGFALPAEPRSPCPGSTSKHWPRHCARAGSRKGRVTTCTSRTENQTQPRVSVSDQSGLGRKQPQSFGHPRAGSQALADEQLPREGRRLCSGQQQLCWPAFAGSSRVAAPSCVNLLPPPS